MTPNFEKQLQQYAELIIKVGINLQPKQRLMINAPVEAAPLVRLITTLAYQHGSPLVDVLWQDDALTLSRFQHAPADSFETSSEWQVQAMLETVKNGGASVRIYGQDPDLLRDQDPAAIATVMQIREEQMKPVRRLGMANHYNWLVVAVPVSGWAAKIFPNEPPALQMSKLWSLIFEICRIDQPDPVAAWYQQSKNLTVRANYLTSKQYKALHYRGPGTDFTLGLADNHIWKGGMDKTSSGIEFMANLPTEEVFSLPHRAHAKGVVSSTRPLSYGGVLIDNFSLKFAGGRVVNVTAERGEATLKRLLERDEGAARLGEVALVPHSSPISQAGVLFYNTLFDENASSHLALGKGYRFCMVNGAGRSDEEFAAAGGNDSQTHVDFMIGSAEMDIDGVTEAGDTEPIMRQGEWAFTV